MGHRHPNDVYLWCRGYAELGRYLGSARNGVWGTSGDLHLVGNEAVLSRGRRPGTQTRKHSFAHPTPALPPLGTPILSPPKIYTPNPGCIICRWQGPSSTLTHGDLSPKFQGFLRDFSRGTHPAVLFWIRDYPVVP